MPLDSCTKLVSNPAEDISHLHIAYGILLGKIWQERSGFLKCFFEKLLTIVASIA